MRLRNLLLFSFLCEATAAFAAPAVGVVTCECTAGKPTAASYTWDFKGEANNIFQEIRDDAQQTLNRADKLQAFADDTSLDWDANAAQLEPLKEEVNDMGRKLCRLEVIRPATAPWQQAEIDRIGKTLRVMANNTANAILFGNAHRLTLWLPEYRSYAANLYTEARTLARSVDTAVSFAETSKQYQQLKQEMGTKSSS